MNEDEEYPTQKLRLLPCDTCGRNFAQESLAKHRNICKKASKPRKIFDSGKQRAEGSDVNYAKTKETKKVQILGEKPEDTFSKPSNWREKHNNFIKTVRNARVVTEAIKTGAPLPKFEASSVPSDYVNCSFCGRNFSSAAAERHIPFCEQQNKRQKMSANNKPKVKTVGQLMNKNSADAGYGRNGSSDSYGMNGMRQGYLSGSNNPKGYTSGNDRKPIKYDSNLYYESDGNDYGSKKGSPSMNAKTKEQMLRTGRNQSNNELNTLARNRGQKDSPMQRRYGNQASPNGPNRVNAGVGSGGYAATRQNSHNNVNAQHMEVGNPNSKFCHECGSEFPVKWARFCSFCGDRRL